MCSLHFLSGFFHKVVDFAYLAERCVIPAIPSNMRYKYMSRILRQTPYFVIIMLLNLFHLKGMHRSSTIHSMDRIMNIKEYLQQHPQWKKRIHGFIMHPVKTRPYWWIRVWQPFYIKKRPGLSHLFQCTERPSTVPPVPDGKIFGSGRFLLLEQCRRRHRNR